MDNAGETVAEMVKGHDRDRYTAILYAPEEHRGGLFALAAFDIELTRIPGLASEPFPGEIRFQWWRDVIEGGASVAGAGNPIAEGLGAAIDRYNLPVATLVNMIEARIFDLYNDPIHSRTELEGYCGETSSALMQLNLLVLEPDSAGVHAEASGHAGCALGIANILLSLPQHRRRMQCYVPGEMLEAAGLGTEDFASGEIGEAHWSAIEAVLALGREHHAAFCKRAGAVSAKSRSAYLPVSVVPYIFKAVEKAGLSVFDAPPPVSPVRRQWVMLRRAIWGW